MSHRLQPQRGPEGGYQAVVISTLGLIPVVYAAVEMFGLGDHKMIAPAIGALTAALRVAALPSAQGWIRRYLPWLDGKLPPPP